MEAARALESFEHQSATVFEPVPPPTLRAVEALADQALGDPALVAAHRRRCRHADGLSDLMARRQDLRGVSRVADHFTDYTRWTV